MISSENFAALLDPLLSLGAGAVRNSLKEADGPDKIPDIIDDVFDQIDTSNEILGSLFTPISHYEVDEDNFMKRLAGNDAKTTKRRSHSAVDDTFRTFKKSPSTREDDHAGLAQLCAWSSSQGRLSATTRFL